MLGHVVEWAELVLVPGDTGGMRGVPRLRPSPPSHPPHSRGLHQAEALARESEEMRRPWKRLTLIPRLRAQNLFAKAGRVCFQRTSF